MGSKDAITLIDNIRDNLNAPIATTENTTGTAGGQWTQTMCLEALNKGKDRLWDLIRSVREDYFLTIANTSINLTTTNKVYTLPSTYRQLVGFKVTTSGYEQVRLRSADMASEEFKVRDALPASSSPDVDVAELLYAIVSTGKLRLADFPPAALATSMDFIAWLADYTLSASSTTEIPDEWAEYMEAYATRKLLLRTPADARVAVWDKEIIRLVPLVLQSVSKRQIRDAEYVEAYDPF